MFFKHRVLQAEYFDLPDRPLAELAEGYRMLAHMNRLFLLSGPFKRSLPAWFGEDSCRSLAILDLGAGDGSLGDDLTNWAARRGWNWQVTNLDLNMQAMRLNPTGSFVAGSVLSLPFRDGAFDVVMGSQMAHHLMTDAEVCQHFKEAWRVTKQVLFMNDLHRNLGLYTVLWLLLWLHRYPDHFLSDGLLSVRRGWRVREWRSLVARAGIPHARVSLYAGARVVLEAHKRP
jgi:hypothetical protein